MAVDTGAARGPGRARRPASAGRGPDRAPGDRRRPWASGSGGERRAAAEPGPHHVDQLRILQAEYEAWRDQSARVPWPTPGRPSCLRACAMSTSTPSTSKLVTHRGGAPGRRDHAGLVRTAVEARTATPAGICATPPARRLARGPPSARTPGGRTPGRSAASTLGSTAAPPLGSDNGTFG